MAEIIQRDGTWAFDGGTVRITPGLHRSVALFRQTYGEITVPVEAVSGVVYEPERKRGRLRLRLREGSDPLLQATGGRLPDVADPYRLTVDLDRAGVAEYVAEEIRQSMLLEQTPKEPAKAYLLPGPPVPVSVRSSDGTVSFDGTRVRIDWNDTSDRVKRATGPRIIDVEDLVSVEWLPNSGYGDIFPALRDPRDRVLQPAAGAGPVRPRPVGQHPPGPPHGSRRHGGHSTSPPIRRLATPWSTRTVPRSGRPTPRHLPPRTTTTCCCAASANSANSTVRASSRTRSSSPRRRRCFVTSERHQRPVESAPRGISAPKGHGKPRDSDDGPAVERGGGPVSSADPARYG